LTVKVEFHRVVLAGVALVVATLAVGAQNVQSYRNPRLPVRERVADLLGRMTIEEKFWQLFMIPGDLENPEHDYSHGVFGLQISVPDGTPSRSAARAHAERINAIQRYFVEKTRLGIPNIRLRKRSTA
jgi:beta-glucosidase